MAVLRRLSASQVPRLAPWTALVVAAAATSTSLLVRAPIDHPRVAPNAAVLGLRAPDVPAELSEIEEATKAPASPQALRSLLDRLLRLGADLPQDLQARVHALAATLVQEIAEAVGRAASGVKPPPRVSPPANPTPSGTAATPSAPAPQPSAPPPSPSPEPAPGAPLPSSSIG